MNRRQDIIERIDILVRKRDQAADKQGRPLLGALYQEEINVLTAELEALDAS